VYIHHGGAPLTHDTSAGETAHLRSYQRNHLGRGWADIAYNFAVGPTSGNVYDLRGWNVRPGATKGHNRGSYAVVIIGDTTRSDISAACITTIRELISQGQRAGRIAPHVQVLGHRDVANTDCPGANAYPHLADMTPPPAPVAIPVLHPPVYNKPIRVRRPRMRGYTVRWIQAVVGADTDGIYGPATKAKTVAWQQANRLPADGIVGPVTHKAMFG
jgi:peptidoglycan hydrolase-like protein with peptidoglycan-binding domain